MNIKSKTLFVCLMGIISSSMANTKFYNDIAISVNDNGGSIKSRFEILVSQAVTSPNPDRGILDPKNTPATIKEIGKTIWSFTTGQLPVTVNDCIEAYVDNCDNDSIYCYNNCLVSSNPAVLALNEKENKFYFLVGTSAIGTGGGPAFLFAADINKKELKLIHAESDQELGSLSPSGKYLIINGDSVMVLYDTQSYFRSELNNSENSDEIRHSLYIKKWLSDTQFIYVDIARHFVRPIPSDGEPFYSAKEAIYDINSRKIISEHSISKEEADGYNKLL